MATLIEETQRHANWVAWALLTSGYQADFSVDSLRGIDRFFAEQSRDGEAVPGGPLSKQLGLAV
jgi:hypothetical protein